MSAWRRVVGVSLTWAGTALLTVGATALAFGASHTRVFAAGVGATLLGLVWQLATGPRLHKVIKAERDSKERAVQRSAALHSILEAGIRALMADLKTDFTDARVSVYRHKNDHFILLARHSDSPGLQSRGRGRYPDSQGLIGRAWQKQEGVVTDLPDDRADWEKKCMSEYDMTADAVKNMAMQSKSLVGKRFDGTSRPMTGIGLIVIESTKKRGVNAATLDELRGSSTYPLLEQILIEAVACLDEQDVDDFNESR